MLPDGHHRPALAPLRVLTRGEVTGGLPVQPQCGELVLPCLLVGLPDPSCLGRVQQGLASLLQFPGSQGFALLVYPPAQRESFRDADLGLHVVGDGVETGDLVFLPPVEQGLVALQPYQRLRPVDPGAQERCDGRRVARRGEVEQRRLGGGPRVAGFLVLAVAFAAGADDPSVLVAPDVDLVLSAGEGAGGELLDQVLVVGA